MSKITEYGPELTHTERAAIATRPIKLRPFQGNDRLRVLINGQGCYCNAKDLCTADTIRVLGMINEERAQGKSTIGLAIRIGDNYIQIDKVR